MLNNKFSCTQLYFLFLLHKDSYNVHDNAENIFVFLLQKYFSICLEPFFAFFLLLLQKDFDIFHVLFLEAFVCVFDNIYLPFLYIEKKIIKNSFLIFFIRIFFIRSFFIGIFFIRIYQNQKKFLYCQKYTYESFLL